MALNNLNRGYTVHKWTTIRSFDVDRVVYPELVYSASGSHFYIEHRKIKKDRWYPSNPMANGQIEVDYDPLVDQMGIGKSVPVIIGDLGSTLNAQEIENFKRALSISKMRNKGLDASLVYGEISIEGTVHTIEIGDWLIVDPNGKKSVCTEEEFKLKNCYDGAIFKV